jgi:hypothetical protein
LAAPARPYRHITGRPLALSLFDAPLDPRLLAAAEAAGVDLTSVLNDVSAPLPNYHYDVLYAQAQNFCAAVRTFGTQLLAALEKKDADALALLLPTLQQQLLVQQNRSTRAGGRGEREAFRDRPGDWGADDPQPVLHAARHGIRQRLQADLDRFAERHDHRLRHFGGGCRTRCIFPPAPPALAARPR